MKAKLLKKLRRKYAKKITISRIGKGWRVRWGNGRYNYYDELTLSDAKDRVSKIVRSNIESYLDEHIKERRHSFNYYPW